MNKLDVLFQMNDPLGGVPNLDVAGGTKAKKKYVYNLQKTSQIVRCLRGLFLWALEQSVRFLFSSLQPVDIYLFTDGSLWELFRHLVYSLLGQYPELERRHVFISSVVQNK